MKNDQLYQKCIETLKENSDAIVLAVAKDDHARVYFSGHDNMLSSLIDMTAEQYVKDILKDMQKPPSRDEIIDDLLREWLRDEGEN
tara:strand:+ start:1183 stop:1440 length:258 start_codon:yes stop_codon:yes gene_type:complete